MGLEVWGCVWLGWFRKGNDPLLFILWDIILRRLKSNGNISLERDYYD